MAASANSGIFDVFSVGLAWCHSVEPSRDLWATETLCSSRRSASYGATSWTCFWKLVWVHYEARIDEGLLSSAYILNSVKKAG